MTWRADELDMLKRWENTLYYFLPDPHAARFCMCLMYVAHIWDDLIDRDKVRTDVEINAAFTMMLGEIPLNPFYQRHIRELAPLLMNASLCWQNAVPLEKGTTSNKLTAYLIRQAVLMVIQHCIYLTCGHDGALDIGQRFWAQVGSEMNERYHEFLEEMR